MKNLSLFITLLVAVAMLAGCVTPAPSGSTPAQILAAEQSQLNTEQQILTLAETAWTLYETFGSPTAQQAAAFGKADTAARAALAKAQADVTAGDTNAFQIDLQAAQAAIAALKPTTAPATAFAAKAKALQAAQPAK